MIGDLLHPARVTALVETVVAVAAILLGLRLALPLTAGLVRRALRADDPRLPVDRQAQVRTLAPLLESALRYVLYFTAAVMVLDRLRFNVAAVVASAGIAGIAMGLGAQHLIRDVLAGFFLLFDGVVQVGDVVRIDTVTGEVERISLRTTQIRQFTGELVTFPNGEIRRVGNMNRGYMRAIVEVALADEVEVQRAMAIMQQVGDAWAAGHPDLTLGPPQVQGILELGAAGTVVRLAIMVDPKARVEAEQALRRDIKASLDAAGIEMGAPRQVVVLRGPRGPAPGAEAG